MSGVAVGETMTFAMALMVIREAAFRTLTAFTGCAAVVGHETLRAVFAAMTGIAVGVAAPVAADVVVRRAICSALSFIARRSAVRDGRTVHAENAAGARIVVGIAQSVRTGMITIKT